MVTFTIATLVAFLIGAVDLWEVLTRRSENNGFLLGTFKHEHAPAVFGLICLMAYIGLCVLGAFPVIWVTYIAAVLLGLVMLGALMLAFREAAELVNADITGILGLLLVLVAHAAPIAMAIGVFVK